MYTTLIDCNALICSALCGCCHQPDLACEAFVIELHSIFDCLSRDQRACFGLGKQCSTCLCVGHVAIWVTVLGMAAFPT
jgi:hypothetical protein